MNLSFEITNRQLRGGVTASVATVEDKEAVLNLLRQTATWLKSKGSTQWNELLSGEDKHDVAGGIERGDVFLFKKDNKLAGMVILQRHANAWDRLLWGEDGHETAVYLHRLAINREFGGGSLGSDILHWALTGIRFAGKDRLRLDCIASVPALNRLYSGAGFRYDRTTPNGFCLYEKMV